MGKQALILVTGATGGIGAEVCAALASHPDLAVRAGLRNPAKRSSLPANVETVSFDFEDPATIDAAMQGVDKVFLLAPGGPVGPPFTRNVVDVIKKHPIRQIVKQSSFEPGSEQGIPTDIWAEEQESMVRELGIPWTFLQPPWCNQNFTRSYFAGMVALGTIELPFGEGRAGWIDARDIGAIAARIFTEEGHDGKSYCITGPKAISLFDVAHLLSQASGRQITYRPLSDAEWLDRCQMMGMPPEAGQAALALIAKTRAGGAERITDEVERLLGRPALSFEQFAQDYAEEIRNLRV